MTTDWRGFSAEFSALPPCPPSLVPVGLSVRRKRR